MGRPTKLTRDRTRRITAAIRKGNYASVAAQAAGIHPATFYGWMRRGEHEESGEFREFFEAVKSAEAEGEAALVSIVRRAALRNWQAAMTMLERKHPERWGRGQRAEALPENPDRLTEEDLQGLSQEELDALAKLRERIDARLARRCHCGADHAHPAQAPRG